MTKSKILFLCTGNSCRSQMAEAWCRALRSDRFDAFSAGTSAKGLNPHAVRVMGEAGIDITGQRSKTVHELLTEGLVFDLVVTVCANADAHCPHFPGGRTRVVHVGFDDPPELARDAATEEEALGHYRRVRDEIRAFVEGLPKSLGRHGTRSVSADSR